MFWRGVLLRLAAVAMAVSITQPTIADPIFSANLNSEASVDLPDSKLPTTTPSAGAAIAIRSFNDWSSYNVGRYFSYDLSRKIAETCAIDNKCFGGSLTPFALNSKSPSVSIDKLRDTPSAKAPSSPKDKDVEVSVIMNGKDTEVIILSMKAENSIWKVDDIRYRTGETLRQILNDEWLAPHEPVRNAADIRVQRMLEYAAQSVFSKLRRNRGAVRDGIFSESLFSQPLVRLSRENERTCDPQSPDECLSDYYLLSLQHGIAWETFESARAISFSGLNAIVKVNFVTKNEEAQPGNEITKQSITLNLSVYGEDKVVVDDVLYSDGATLTGYINRLIESRKKEAQRKPNPAISQTKVGPSTQQLFEKYLVPVTNLPPTAPRFDSKTFNFRTRFSEAARQQSNFAGHYVLSTWGCGSSCITGGILNKKTGTTAFLPFAVITCCWEPNPNQNWEPIQVRRDSRLLILNGKIEVPNRNVEDVPPARHLYAFDGTNFKLVGSIRDASFNSATGFAPVFKQ